MKILLADDHALFRDSMSIWIQQLPEITEVKFAEDKESVLKILAEDLNLIMLDLDMPNMSGILSVSEFTKKTDAPILIVSANQSVTVAQACLKAGASGYICKLCSGEEILEAVKIVLNGERYIQKLGVCVNETAIHTDLSLKQMKILYLLGEGYSNKQIAEKLFLSIGTVKQYVSNILNILDVENRTQAGKLSHKILGSNRF